MDVLSDVLDALELRGTLYFRTRSTPPWGVQMPAYRNAARFHMVVRGRCHLRFENGSAVQLETGDMVIIPRGTSHVLSDLPDSPVLHLDDAIRITGYTGEGVFAYGGSGNPEATTELICGHFSFREGVEHPLLRALPDYLTVTADIRARHIWLDEIMRLTARLMFADSPGAGASVIRLSEILFVETIRACSEKDLSLKQVLDAMSHARIGKALVLIHRQPEYPWTVASLGSAVAMSRSRFAAQFQSMMGCSPMAYLTEWRLQRARTLLTQSRATGQQIAAQVGYKSAAAFSRAFSQRFGKAPTAERAHPN